MSEWISVKDEPKPLCRAYWVWDEELRSMYVATYDSGEWMQADDDCPESIGRITHWMPLPEPPA